MRMPIKEPQNIGLLSHFLALFMTLLGALASYSYKVLNGEQFRWKVFVLQMIVAIFAGFLIMLAANYYHWPAELAGGTAGLAGWSGAEFIKALEKRFLRNAEGGSHGN